METIAQFLESSFEGILEMQTALILLTILVFYSAQLLNSRLKSPLLHPILVSTLVIIATLHLIGVDYQRYYEANEPITFILGVSVVCLGYPMHKNFNRIKEYKLTILLSTFLGSLVGIASIIGLGYLFDLEHIITISLAPKSITTPIALSLCDSLGGLAAITSLSVMVAGMSGSILGPYLLRICDVSDPVARGLAMGSASHAVGTARALEVMGAIEGAVGGVAIGLMGLFTSILLPLILQML